MAPSGPDTDSSTFSSRDGSFDFNLVKEANRTALFDLLDSLHSSEDGQSAHPLTIIWDPELTKPFSLIANLTELKAHGVSRVLKLERDAAGCVEDGRGLFFVKPQLNKMDAVIDNLKRIEIGPFSPQFFVVFIPRGSVACEGKLRESGVSTKVTDIKDLPIHMFMWEKDLLSMQNPAVLTQCLINEDWANGLFDVSCCISQLEEILGEFALNCVWYKGDWAKHVVNLVRRRKQQEYLVSGLEKKTEIGVGNIGLVDQLFVVDRMVDTVTPFITQLTYEGLIDELFGINCASAKFPRDRFSEDKEGQSSEAQDKSVEKQVSLNSSDDLYSDLRDLHFNAVGPKLSKKIKYIAEQSDQHKQSKTVHELKEFVKRLPQLQASKVSAGVHTTIAEMIKETTTDEFFLSSIQCEQEILNCIENERTLPFIENCIAKGENMWKVLRLICLHCCVSDGFKSRTLDQYRNEFLQSYGHQYIPLLVDLHRAGLLRERGTHSSRAVASTYAKNDYPSNFASLSKSLELIVEGVDERKPTDVSYVYSGYAPIIARILKKYWCSRTWRELVDVLKKLPGATGVRESLTDSFVPQPLQSVDNFRRQVVLVLFIGGVTMAEVSAIRFINNQQSEYQFFIITTHLINGDGLLKMFVKS